MEIIGYRGATKSTEGDQFLRILGVRGSMGTRRNVNILFIKVRGT